MLPDQYPECKGVQTHPLVSRERSGRHRSLCNVLRGIASWCCVARDVANVENGRTSGKSRTTVNHPRKDVPARWSLRIAVVFVVIIVVFFAVAFIFLFVFFLVWLLSKEDIGRQPIKRG